MKTAEEWEAIWPDTDFDTEKAMINRIKAIQADARQAALTEAAELCKEAKAGDKYAKIGMQMCADAIIAMRDSQNVSTLNEKHNNAHGATIHWA